MISFETEVEKFGEQGEKTGWTYVLISCSLAEKLKPENKKSFRVKGLLDEIEIYGMALIPMGDGDFILPLKAALRKKLRKEAGKKLRLTLEEDKSERKTDADLEICLENDENANSFFLSLAPSHRLYFSKWISEAKTIGTKEIRILTTLNALRLLWDFGKMLREKKKLSP